MGIVSVFFTIERPSAQHKAWLLQGPHKFVGVTNTLSHSHLIIPWVFRLAFHEVSVFPQRCWLSWWCGNWSVIPSPQCGQFNGRFFSHGYFQLRGTEGGHAWVIALAALCFCLASPALPLTSDAVRTGWHVSICVALVMGTLPSCLCDWGEASS